MICLSTHKKYSCLQSCCVWMMDDVDTTLILHKTSAIVNITTVTSHPGPVQSSIFAFYQSCNEDSLKISGEGH